LPFFNMRMYRNNYQTISKAVDKMNRGELKLEDILDDDELVMDVKSNPNSQLASFFSNEVIRKLIEYSTRMPESDDLKFGHKYPFNACEILCSESSFIMDRLFEMVKIEDDNTDSEHDTSERKESKASDRYRDDHSDDSSENSVEKVEKNLDSEIKIIDSENGEEASSDHVKVEEQNKTEPESVDELTHQVANLEIKEEANKEETTNSVDTENKVEGDITSNVQESNNESADEQGANEQQNNEPQIANENVNPNEENNANNDAETSNPEEGSNQNDDQNKNTANDNANHEEDLDLADNINEISQDEKHVPVKDETQELIIYEMLDYFYKFLESNDELNFVLSGYFSKIFNHLMNLRGSHVLKYLFYQRNDLISCFIKHMNRKAISECVYRILIAFTDDIKDATEHKVAIIDKILSEIENNDPEKVDNISDLLLECLTNRKFYYIFISNVKLLEKLHRSVVRNLDQSISKDLIKILAKINENILKDFGNAVTPVFAHDNNDNMFNFNNIEANMNIDDDSSLNYNTKSSNGFNIKNHLDAIFDILSESSLQIIADFTRTDNDSVITTTYDQKKRILGAKKLAEFEYLKTIIDILINGYASNLFIDKLNESVEKIIKTDLFKVAIENFIEFEFNNVYQKYFEQLMILTVNKYTPEELIKHVFVDCNFLNLLITNCENNLKFKFNSGKEINSGFFPVLCEIALHVSASENVYLKEITDKNERFKNFCKYFVEPIKNRFNQGLLYNIQATKIITNFDRLNSPLGDYDYAETHSKESDSHSNVPLNEIIKSCFNEFLNGKKEESKDATSINDRKDSSFNYDNDFNPIDFISKLESKEKESLDEGFIKDRQDYDDPIFEVRENIPKMDFNIKEENFNINENIYGMEDSTKEEEEQSDFYDNHYWKGLNVVDNEDFLKEL